MTLPEMRVFIVGEGDPIQELSALCVRTDTLQIVSVFHEYANCLTSDDNYARHNIHGLDTEFLSVNGFPSLCELTSNFCQWIDLLPAHHDYVFYGNNPSKLMQSIPFLIICKFELPQWKDRIHLQSHKMAVDAKKVCATILDKKCPSEAHDEYLLPHRPIPVIPSS